MPRVLVIATGGTIASLPTEDGLAPALTGEELIARVPLIEGLCDIDVVQPMNIDSTNMRPRDWLVIAGIVQERYEDYDGFVVLHGTDTLAYTAAALSYLVQGSEKPIVLTGSQQPMAAPFTDAKLNLYHSLLWACDSAARDVCVVFGGHVIAGTRARKQRTMSANAFTSLNFPDLAVLRGEKIVRAAVAQTAPAERRFYRKLNERVGVIKLTPALRLKVFELIADEYDAVVLETFGVGGIPAYDDRAFERAIMEWVDAGKTLVLTTQVPEEGLDLGIYEVGRRFASHPGILEGADMCAEAILAKTMWALEAGRDADEVRELFYTPINHDRM